MSYTDPCGNCGKHRPDCICKQGYASVAGIKTIDNEFMPAKEPLNIPDGINHPLHYGGYDNPYEAIKVIEAWHLDFCLGNVLKYICRAGEKSADTELTDLKKARWYLQRRIEQLEKQ